MTLRLQHTPAFYLQITMFFEWNRGDSNPLTSAVQKRQDRLPEVFEGCKTPANRCVSAQILFPAFQEIYSGCCTVAAHSWPALRLVSRAAVRWLLVLRHSMAIGG